MDDFNPELYRKLSDFIESGCKKQNIEKNYVEYLFSMEQADSIDKLIKIYNNIFKLLSVIYYGGKNVPYNWYIYERWENEPREMVEELNQYFNDNILRWVKRQSYKKRVHYTLSLINLRECRNTGYIQRKILNIEGAPDNIMCYAAWRHLYHEKLIEINQGGTGNESKELLLKYKHYSKLLIANGYIFNVIEEAFAKQHNIDYHELLVEYDKELEEKEKEAEDKIYDNLLQFFDKYYEYDTDSTKYSEIILSMQNENSVNSLVKTYNRVLKKLLIIAYHGEEYISETWYEYGLPGDNRQVWDNLKAYLNKQIKRVFDENTYSDKLALECITNLREALNEKNIKDYIGAKSSEEVNAELENIENCRNIVSQAHKRLSPYNKETNGFREYKPIYIENIKSLIKNGYHTGLDDQYFELKTGVSYFPNNSSIFLFIVALILLIPLMFFLMNYAIKGFFMLICILALIKMIKR